jgi:hypothetical protein
MDFNSLDLLFKNDLEKSVNGVPHEIGRNEKDEPIILIVAEANNSSNEKFAKIARKYERSFEMSRRNAERRKQIWIKIVAEAILISWEGILDKDGREVPATLENKISMLGKYDDLLAEVLSVANDHSNYLPEDVDIEEVNKETEKNSETPSAGT